MCHLIFQEHFLLHGSLGSPRIPRMGPEVPRGRPWEPVGVPLGESDGVPGCPTGLAGCPRGGAWGTLEMYHLIFQGSLGAPPGVLQEPGALSLSCRNSFLGVCRCGREGGREGG